MQSDLEDVRSSLQDLISTAEEKGPSDSEFLGHLRNADRALAEAEALCPPDEEEEE